MYDAYLGLIISVHGYLGMGAQIAVAVNEQLPARPRVMNPNPTGRGSFPKGNFLDFSRHRVFSYLPHDGKFAKKARQKEEEEEDYF